ncbi:MAG: ion transporter [Agathobacter sp.]|nr:ion transporter [Agathobacter sp.]
MGKKWDKRRKRLFDIIEVGSDYDVYSRAYDFINAGAILLNIIASIMYTFDECRVQYGLVLVIVIQVTIAFFAVDYFLRIWTAKFQFKGEKEIHAIRKYVFSTAGIIDLLSFLPEYLPFFFPAGAVAFRMVRIIRIFRLFRINRYYDALNVISEVLKSRKQQLISSVFIIVMLMIASSLCMYSLEHEAQPEVFSNAFSGIWWAASTLLTVGYGDIYPVTMLGKIFGIFIAFLGVGMVAIPTGIISAGFVEQYSEIKKRSRIGYEEDMHFICVPVQPNDSWVGKRIADLDMPVGVIITILKRKEQILIPRGDLVLQIGDCVILGAEPFKAHEHIHLKEIVLRAEHPWVDKSIEELDISRHSIVVLVKRKNKAHIPNGNMVLKEWDRLFVYTDKYLTDAMDIEI